jgi:hypothetical protein
VNRIPWRYCNTVKVFVAVQQAYIPDSTAHEGDHVYFTASNAGEGYFAISF